MKADPILKEFGLTDEQIKAINEHPEEKASEFDLKPVLETGRGVIKTNLLNDPEFYTTLPIEKLPADYVKKVEANQYGRFVNELRDYATKTLGLKEGEDFTAEDATKLKTFAEKTYGKYAEKHGKKDVNEIQSQLQKALGEKTELEGSLAQKIQDAVNGEKALSAKTIEKLIGISKVSAIKDLGVKPGLVADSLMAALKDKYTVVFNPAKLDFDIKQKASPTLAVLGKDGKELTFDEALNQLAIDEGVIVKKDDKKEEIDPITGKVKVTVSGDEAIPSYIKDKMGDEVKPK